MTPAIKLLDNQKTKYIVREYDATDSAGNYGEAAASALKQNPAQVFKTLLAIIDGNERKPVVALVAVADQLDLKKLANAMKGRKAVMAEPSHAQRCTGYIIGGISPLAQRQLLPTVIDSSAELYEHIFVSGGKRGLQLQLSPNDLLNLVNGRYAQISRAG